MAAVGGSSGLFPWPSDEALARREDSERAQTAERPTNRRGREERGLMNSRACSQRPASAPTLGSKYIDEGELLDLSMGRGEIAEEGHRIGFTRAVQGSASMPPLHK